MQLCIKLPLRFPSLSPLLYSLQQKHGFLDLQISQSVHLDVFLVWKTKMLCLSDKILLLGCISIWVAHRTFHEWTYWTKVSIKTGLGMLPASFTLIGHGTSARLIALLVPLVRNVLILLCMSCSHHHIPMEGMLYTWVDNSLQI